MEKGGMVLAIIEDAFPILETNRLKLRKIEDSDAGSILKYLSDQEVMKYYGLDPFQTLEEALDEISWYESIYTKDTGIRWGISLKENGEIIGSCGFLNRVKEHHRTEIGYELSKEYWGTGIAREALEAIIEYGFHHLQFQRIAALIEIPNIASQKLAERLGFVKEGLLRNYECTDGKFDDLYMYSLLKGELHTGK